MKRIIAFLLALTLAFGICACGKTDNGGDAGNDTESKTAQDYAEAAYVAMISMMSGMYDGNTTKVYRFDYDHDGVDDWLVHYDDAQQFWMLFKGGESQPTPTIFFNWGAAGSLELLYSKSDDSIYIKNAYSVITHGYESYFRYDGTAHDYCLNSSYSDGEPWDSTPPDYEYFVCDEQVTEDEYFAEVDKLKLRELTGGTRGFNSFFDQPADMLESIAELISQYPFVTEYFTKDIDGDGVDECIFGTKLELDELADEHPCGVTALSYECGNEGYESYGFDHFWKSPYFALSSGGDGFYITDNSVTEPEETEKPKVSGIAQKISGVWTTMGYEIDTSASQEEQNKTLFGFFKRNMHAELIRFDTDGGVYISDTCPYLNNNTDDFSKMGEWSDCGSGKTKFTDQGVGPTCEVTFGRDDNYGVDCMFLSYNGESLKFYKGLVTISSDNIVGTWEANTSYSTIKLILRADGAFEESSGERMVAGIWSLNGGQVELYIDGYGRESGSADYIYTCDGPYITFDPGKTMVYYEKIG